jgi:hypothetical protein
MTSLDKRFDLVIFKDAIFEVCVRWLFVCAFIWEYLCLVWCWIISHPHKMCIELPSCNVKILTSLKNDIIWYYFCRIANYMFNIALHTYRGSDLGQSMCHRYVIDYSLKEITCTLHYHFCIQEYIHPACITCMVPWN